MAMHFLPTRRALAAALLGASVTTFANAQTYEYRNALNGVRVNGPSKSLRTPVLAPPSLGDAAVTVSAQRLEWGARALDEPVTLQLLVQSVGAAPVLLLGAPYTSGAQSFSAQAFSCAPELAPGMECLVSVTFNPTLAGLQSGELVLALSSGTVHIPLTGEGLSGQVAYARADLPQSLLSSLALEQADVGRLSGEQTVVVSNPGRAPVVFGAQPFETSGPFEISQTTCTSRTLAPGEQCTVVLFGRPTQDGLVNATLTPRTNVRGAPALTVRVSGVTFTPAQVLTTENLTPVLIQKADGTWWGSGDNGVGTLGIGDTETRPSFVRIAALDGATRIVMDDYVIFAQRPDGTWVAAGDNAGGQLGLGDTVFRKTFTRVPGLDGAVEVIASANGTFARFADGSWKAAGNNSLGQLGLGDTTRRTSFTPVPALAGAQKVIALYQATYAKLANGTWAATGANWYGNLGVGDYANRKSFTPLPGSSSVVELYAKSTYAFARHSDGSWSSFGSNNAGSLGVGDFVDRTVLTPVPALTGAQLVQVGNRNVFAKFADGTWAATGDNYYGQLGLGDKSNRASFTTLPALANATEVKLGGFHVLAKKPDGTWVGAGWNVYGQLGLGDWLNRTSFVPVPALAGATWVRAEFAVTMASGGGRGWRVTGANDYGQLGLGDWDYHNSFEVVPSTTLR